MTYSNLLVGHSDLVLCIYGPSGSGKSTLAKYIIKHNNSGREIEIIKSYTTRSKRKGEIDEDHIFISEEEFIQKVQRKEIQLYGKPHNQNYFVGYDIRYIAQCMKEGRIPIIVTRVPDILKNLSEIFTLVLYCDVTNFSELILRLERRDGKLTNEEKYRLGVEAGVLSKLTLKPQIEDTIGIRLLFNFDGQNTQSLFVFRLIIF